MWFLWVVARLNLELSLKVRTPMDIRAAAHLELVLMPHKVYFSQGMHSLLVGFAGLTLSCLALLRSYP